MKQGAFFLFLLIVFPAFAASANSPADAASAFYRVYAGQRGAGGIPDATARQRFAAVLSPRLNRQLADAAAAQARLSAKVKNAVPPMLEGDIFSSLFEGATDWQVGACKDDGKTARCPVALTHAQPLPSPTSKTPQPAHWNDTLVLTNTPAGWKVDDVIYDAGFAFGNTGRLSDMLALVVASNP